MNKETRFSANALLALALLVGLQGCASTSASTSPAEASAAPSASESATVSKDTVTVENLLRWPLEGFEGAEKTAAGLRQVFKVEEARPSLSSGHGPAVLVDGHVLSSVYLGPGPNAIDIGVEEEPCFTAERAAKATGATASPITTDIHGVDRGRTYDARRNGMWVSFTTTPVSYRCVTAIHIRRAKEGQP